MVNTGSKGFIGRIPVENIWVLMTYAQRLRLADGTSPVASSASPDGLLDVVIELFIQASKRKVKAGLTQEYISKTAALNRVRGRINALETESRQLLSSGRVSCTYQDYTTNTQLNNYLCNALKKSASLATSTALRSEARALVKVFVAHGVNNNSAKIPTPRITQIGLIGSRDFEILEIAKLLHMLSIPTEESGPSPIANPSKEEHWARQLFEKAMAGFFSHSLPKNEYTVKSGSRIQWPITDFSNGISNILPNMITDIEIKSLTHSHKLVIDTKFNSITTQGRWSERSLRSQYLYQMYSYLRSQEEISPSLNSHSAGLLLHPTVDEELEEFCVIQNHRLTFATVDLTRSPSHIKHRLMSIFQSATIGYGRDT